MSSRRRSSLLKSQQQSSSSSRIRRPSITEAVRRSSRTMSQSAMSDVQIHLGRVATAETPTNRKARQERRSSRKENMERIRSNRSERLADVQDQWKSHRQSFRREEEEIAEIVDNNRSWSSYCCGMNLCCNW